MADEFSYCFTILGIYVIFTCIFEQQEDDVKPWVNRFN